MVVSGKCPKQIEQRVEKRNKQGQLYLRVDKTKQRDTYNVTIVLPSIIRPTNIRGFSLLDQCNIRQEGVSRVLAWKTGQSGNRKGRPRLDEVEKQNVAYFKQQLKKYSVTALEELFELMSNSINQDIRYKWNGS